MCDSSSFLGCVGISLSQLLPPEKSETVIYILPSVALSFWTVNIFFTTADLTEWIALVGLLGSVFTILAYMVPLDVYIIRRLFRG